MSVFSRFALRSLAKNRTRTIVSVIGIALSCALITAVLTSVVSIQTLLAERTAADEGTWQVEAAGLSEQGLSFIEDDDRIAEIAKMLSGSQITQAAVAQARILLGR